MHWPWRIFSLVHRLLRFTCAISSISSMTVFLLEFKNFLSSNMHTVKFLKWYYFAAWTWSMRSSHNASLIDLVVSAIHESDFLLALSFLYTTCLPSCFCTTLTLRSTTLNRSLLSVFFPGQIWHLLSSQGFCSGMPGANLFFCLVKNWRF